MATSPIEMGLATGTCSTAAACLVLLNADRATDDGFFISPTLGLGWTGSGQPLSALN